MRPVAPLDWAERETRRHSSSLIGFVRDVSHVATDSDRVKALAALTGLGSRELCLQFGDSTSDVRNRADGSEWSDRIRRLGISVTGWWRVRDTPGNDPPQIPTVILLWWANAEAPDEFDRLPEIYRSNSHVHGLVTLGKLPTLPPLPLRSGSPVAIECFRESELSDTNVRNSVKHWEQQGIPSWRLIPMLQGYGTPFAPAIEEARVAVELGCRRLALYPFDGFTPHEITEIGELLLK